MMANLAARLLPACGFYISPAAWLVSTVANYALAASLCGDTGRLAVASLTAALAMVSLGSGALSWRGWQRSIEPPDIEQPRSFAPRRLVAGVGALMGLLFAVVIALQGAASLFIAGCAR